MKKFNRRIYPNFSTFFSDFKFIISQRDQIRPLMRGEMIDSTFRERLMLAVTSVNDCRYCSFAHAKQALAEGINQDEIQALQDGLLDISPRDELPALLYAQHWAETRGDVDSSVRDKMITKYDDRTVKAIELILRMIQMGNLLGNTLDYILFRISFGLLGFSRNKLN